MRKPYYNMTRRHWADTAILSRTVIFTTTATFGRTATLALHIRVLKNGRGGGRVLCERKNVIVIVRPDFGVRGLSLKFVREY